MSLTSIKCTSACIYTRNVYCSHQISWWHSSAYEMTFKLPTDRGCMADEGIYKMKAPCICTLTLLVKSKQFFLFRWALFTDSSTFIKQKQVEFRLNTICFFIESFTVSCNENKIFAKTCKDLQRLAKTCKWPDCGILLPRFNVYHVHHVQNMHMYL